MKLFTKVEVADHNVEGTVLDVLDLDIYRWQHKVETYRLSYNTIYGI